MSISRREWLNVSAGAAASAITSPLLAGLSQWFRPAQLRAATVQTVVSACGVCSPACGLKITLEDGVIRFVEGLPGDLSGGGKLCGKGAAAADFLYDPDRLKYPMKRTNPRKGFDEDPGWVRISWTEALDTIAQKIEDARRQYGAESLLFVTLPSPDVLVRLLNALGVVNRIDHIDECFLADRIVQRYMTGGKSWCIDFANAKYILLFGWDILAKAKIVYANDLVNAKANGAKVVLFNPQYSATARFADEHFSIKPGTDLAVALAMIHVLLNENLFHKEFVDKYTNFGQFEREIREHFQRYTPEWAEEISSVPAADIRRIAREFGTNRPAIVPAHKKTLCANYANASQLMQAITILNILAGTIDRPGGRYFARSISVPGVDAIYPPPPYPPRSGRRVDGKDKLPLVLEDGGGMFSTLADGILNRFPGMIQFAFVNGYTALGFPQPQQMERALKTIPFLVTMDVLPTDTVTLADIALPSTMYLEVNDIVTREYNAKFPQAVPRTAVAPPIFEARSAGFVALELGKRLVPEYFKTPNGEFINLSTLLDEKVRRAGLGENFAEFRERGLTSRPAAFVPRETFATPGNTGKCQIYVPQFAERGVDPLPVWRPKREEPSAQYPYYLLTFIPAVHKRNSTQNNKILHEMMPSNDVQIPAALAAKLGIREGDLVRVRSRVGQIELPAHLTETLREDCVMIAHGFGHRSRLLSLAGGKGARDGDLIPSQTIDDVVKSGNFGGAACIMDAVVQIEKVNR
ncbi:MAG: molybdopterin-dependent oxidoreductase [Bryobacteraceae bacterium]|nr:molybdopterin-dependent oxidoreductase [Bryobacteraceae bacterium]MDW8379915.1 molybdopterin-dependent oxidoreductase [Bryobacterales bacterium]